MVHLIIGHRSTPLILLVIWERYKDPTWEPYETIRKDVPILVQEYISAHERYEILDDIDDIRWFNELKNLVKNYIN